MKKTPKSSFGLAVGSTSCAIYGWLASHRHIHKHTNFVWAMHISLPEKTPTRTKEGHTWLCWCWWRADAFVPSTPYHHHMLRFANAYRSLAICTDTRLLYKARTEVTIYFWILPAAARVMGSAKNASQRQNDLTKCIPNKCNDWRSRGSIESWWRSLFKTI